MTCSKLHVHLSYCLILFFSLQVIQSTGIRASRIDRRDPITPANNSTRSPPASAPILKTANSSIPRTRVQAVQSAPKLVFAHFIAGLTIDYTKQDWIDQISLASSHGIDAFALNVGAPDSWQVGQVSTAYDVAKEVSDTSGQPFKMFLSLDMSVIQTSDQVSAWVTKFAQKDSQLLVGGKVFISTFSGESNTFGASNASVGWTAAVKDPLAGLNPAMEALFVPAWSGLDPNTAVSTNPVVDGIMTWKAWPTDNENKTTTVDLLFQADAKKNNKVYMASVSPCFYTHYHDKNFIFKSDDNLYINRWKDLIAMPTQPDFIEIVSWNDYGESHYIGPIKGSVPDGTTWIQGLDHQAWLDMTDYFIQWYKTGSPPPITEDKVYFSYRPHSVSAVASSDSLGPPSNASSATDAVYLAAFLPLNSTAQKLKVSVGNVQQTFTQLTPGSISTFALPWNGNGGDVYVDLLDGSGVSLLASKGQKPISNSIDKYNFNYASEVLMKGGFNPGQKAKAKAKANAKSSSSSMHENLPMSWTSCVGLAIILMTRIL